jgi:ribosomal protein L11 methyltransferase
LSYVALRFDVEAAQAEAWSDALLDAGALSVDVADPRAGTPEESAVFDERESSAPAWWSVSRLTALFADADVESALQTAASAIDADAPPHETYVVGERDWLREAQAQFEPVRIDDDLWIVPSWHAPRPHAINITLDPGLAFGTGSHPTTRLCLAWLREAVTRGASLLDYGCGSGILAIAGARLGAGEVVGTDIDGQALAAAQENARRNGVEASFVEPQAVPERAFDIVMANILANPLRVLAPLLAARLTVGGRIALAGILAPQADDVVAAYAGSVALHAWREEDGWVLLTGTRQ